MKRRLANSDSDESLTELEAVNGIDPPDFNVVERASD